MLKKGIRMLINEVNTTDLSNRDLILFNETICNNPYLFFKPYPRQSWPIFYANQELNDNEPNQLLVGAGGFGGKTYLGSMLAAQYLTEPEYSCLISRLNYAELTGPDSIWENLNEWICDEDRLGDYACKSNESKLRISAPSGAKIWFKAFDRPSKKSKVKSESYDRIINDEASELHPDVLQFLFRSLRQEQNSQIPLSMINLSNPGGPSTIYLRDKFVDGKYNYYPLDWRHNPFINREIYSKTLDNLSFVDRQYQKYGNWHYEIESGDIFNNDLIINSTINIDQYTEITNRFAVKQVIRSWDIAATEKKTSDYTASSLMEILEHGHIIVKKQDSTKLKPGPLQTYMKTIMAMDGPDVNQWIEHQPAAAGVLVDYYFTEEFKDYNVQFFPVFANKVLRAGRMVPLMERNKDNDLTDMTSPRLFFLEDNDNPYLPIFTKQAINFPNFDNLNDIDDESRHDDRIDTISLIVHEFDKRSRSSYTRSDQAYEGSDYQRRLLEKNKRIRRERGRR